MAKYGELYFAESKRHVPINKYIKKLPFSLRYRLCSWRNLLKCQKQIKWGIEGERVQLPLTYTNYRKVSKKNKEKLFRRIENKLSKKQITHVTLPYLIKENVFADIKECTGEDIKVLFIMDIIRFVAKENIVNKKLEDMELIILDGNMKNVDIIIDLIYPYINHLTIVSNTPARFDERSQYIFQDVGLNVQVLSYTKEAISQGDIIIDTHYQDPSVIYYCKKNSLYLDIGNNKEKTIALVEGQGRVKVIDQFQLIKNGEIVSSKKAEMLLRINNTLSRNYKETVNKINKQDIEIYKLV